MAKRKKSFMSRVRSDVLTNLQSDMYHVGFEADQTLWVDSGNLALNRMMSGRFDGAFLFGKNYMLYGESGSGKSLMAAYLCSHAQRDHDAMVIWLDVEKASEEVFFTRANVDTGEEVFERVQCAELVDVYNTINKTIKDYRKAQKEGEELPPVVFVVDSWSMILTKGQMEQMEKNELKGDQGQKAKQTGDVITRLNHALTGLPIMIIGIAHIYDSQEMHGPKHKTTGGHKLQFAATGCLMLTKNHLKAEDIDDPEIRGTIEQSQEGYTAELKKKMKYSPEGFICNAENLKSRVSKPFQKVVVQVPYKSGMDRFSGLFETMMSEGTISKAGGAYYSYGKGDDEVKFFRKDFREHIDALVTLSSRDISDAAEDIPEDAALPEAVETSEEEFVEQISE